MKILRKLELTLKEFDTIKKHLSVGEEMMPYYGSHSFKIFILCKPVRFGFKQWMLSSSVGCPFHMDVYTGMIGFSKDTTVPLGSKVLREMLKCLRGLGCHVVFMDNFTLYVLADIRIFGFRAAGTVREVSLKKYPLEKMKESD
jgi:hypothetical protein